MHVHVYFYTIVSTGLHEDHASERQVDIRTLSKPWLAGSHPLITQMVILYSHASGYILY